jgi:hypothetical protein
MLRVLLVALLLQVPGLASADSAADLSSCVSDNTSGKQRKDLARWVFLAMAAHPDLKQFASAEVDAVRDPTDKTVAEMFEQLITVQCATQANAAYTEHGTPGLEVAFEELGRLAMMELMSNPDASAAMGTFERYLDRSKITAALTGK